MTNKAPSEQSFHRALLVCRDEYVDSISLRNQILKTTKTYFDENRGNYLYYDIFPFSDSFPNFAENFERWTIIFSIKDRF